MPSAPPCPFSMFSWTEITRRQNLNRSGGNIDAFELNSCIKLVRDSVVRTPVDPIYPPQDWEPPKTLFGTEIELLLFNLSRPEAAALLLACSRALLSRVNVSKILVFSTQVFWFFSVFSTHFGRKRVNRKMKYFYSFPDVFEFLGNLIF